MALTWDLTGCEDCDSLKATDEEWAKTDAIIWYTMFTEIGWEITPENAADFYARIHVWELLHSCKDADAFITPEDIRKRIGLRVNVAPKTKLQFLKRTVQFAYDDALKEYAKAEIRTV
jgi:hypothetical protein